MPTIKIESILGGHAPTTHFAQPNQFRASLGIDPSMPTDDANSATSTIPAGLLRPTLATKITSTTVQNLPQWMTSTPKDANIYIYDAQGSAYSLGSALDGGAFAALSDGGTLISSSGNGMAYYDNYIYFAKNADIARYGPLNGSPAFTGTYWTGTLGKTALSNQAYSTASITSKTYPNHFMHRHSDGKLYIADTISNQGAVHFISTTRTTVEGDTDNGSTYNKLSFGYGLWPIAMESYGSDLVIALVEGVGNPIREPRAKLAFWDTTSQNFNKITWVEFPDPLVTAMKNINGVLYFCSGNPQAVGWRITRFIGGYTFEEVASLETGDSPFPGAIDGTGNRLLIGGQTSIPESSACVYSFGLQKSALGQGLFNIMRNTGVFTSAILLADNNNFGLSAPIAGWGNGSSGGTVNGIDTRTGSDYSPNPQVWWSSVFRIGQPFKITKIRIPLVQAVAANMTLIPKIYTDDGVGTTYTLATINNTNYTNSERNIVLRPPAATAQHNFWLELRWSGSALLTVNLPITVEYELIND